MNKIRLGLIFGGRSAEHEVSVESAKNVYEALDKEKYEIILIGIDKKGVWYPNLYHSFLLSSSSPVISSEVKELIPSTSSKDFSVASLLRNDIGKGLSLDVIFPILHGPFGEDGTIQGLLKLANIPFVGASVLGSAVGMDKDVSKRLLRDAGLPIAKFIVYSRVKRKRASTSLSQKTFIPSKEGIWPEASEVEVLNFGHIKEELGLPFFVKPVNLGSSVGVSKVHDESEFEAAVEKAFQFDTKIIIEEAIQGREIECAVLGNESPKASIAGEITPRGHEFYDYEAKYTDEKGADIIIPADIPDEKLQEIQHLAIKTFQILCCEGLARVDFFLTKDGKVYVNEINTIPGFTNISMYPKLWEASGIGYPELIDRLIELAITRHKRDATLQSTRY